MASGAVPRRVGHQRRQPARGCRVQRSPETIGSWATTSDRSSSLRVSRADVSFLTRTSILDRMSGPLCDVTVGGKGSSRVLDRLERRNLLVIPLDRRGEWYRYHHLFRELLHAELMRREPDMVPELHTRAAAWYEANNLPEAAIEHAQHAGDADRVARLVLKVANPVWASGRMDTVLRWMEWFSANDLIEQPPGRRRARRLDLRAHRPGRRRRTLGGGRRTRPAHAARWPTGTPWRARWRTCARCCAATDSTRCATTRRRRCEGLSPTSPYRAAMLHAQGVAHLLQGDPDQADLFFARAVDEATSAGVLPFIPVLLAERGLVAIERDDWPEAEALATQALAIMHDGQFDDYWTSALVYAWGARIASHRGEVARPVTSSVRAARLRPLLTYALPIVSVQALLELARAYIALADPGGARAALRQIHDIHQHRPELGTLPDQAAELRAKLDTAHEVRCSAPRRSPRPNCDCCRCCPRTSRLRRSASGCTSPATRSRHKRSRSTASSASRPAARRSPACTSSAWSPTPRWPTAASAPNGSPTPSAQGRVLYMHGIDGVPADAYRHQGFSEVMEQSSRTSPPLATPTRDSDPIGRDAPRLADPTSPAARSISRINRPYVLPHTNEHVAAMRQQDLRPAAETRRRPPPLEHQGRLWPTFLDRPNIPLGADLPPSPIFIMERPTALRFRNLEQEPFVCVSGGPKLLLDRRAATPAPPTAPSPARPPRRGPRPGWRRASLSRGSSPLKDNPRPASAVAVWVADSLRSASAWIIRVARHESCRHTEGRSRP